MTDRKRLPSRRFSMSWGFTCTDSKGIETAVHISIGEYKNGKIGEVFIDVSKDGTFQQDSFKSLALAMSLALQHGATIRDLRHTMRFMETDPPITKEIFDQIETCYKEQITGDWESK